MRRWLALGLVVAGLVSAHVARAEPAARFVYSRGKGSEACPEEGDVRQAVVSRLGYDPFSSDAAATMFTEVVADGDEFRANLKLVDGDDAVRGDRSLKTRGPCAELMEAMALTISIAIDPESATRDDLPPAAPPLERSAPPPAPARPAELHRAEHVLEHDFVRESPPATPLALSASLGPLVSVGTAPGVAFGGAFAVDGQYGLLFAGAEARADAAASGSATPFGRVRSSLVMGSLFVGLRRGALFVGAVGGLGSIHATSREVAEERDADARVLAAGLRAGVAVPLVRWLELRVRLEGLGNLTRHTLQLDGREAYRYPAVSGNASAALAVRFW